MFHALPVVSWASDHFGLRRMNQIWETGSKLQDPAAPPAPGIKNFWLQLRLQNHLVHWKRKNIILFVQLLCPANWGCGSGTQISGSGSAPPSESFGLRILLFQASKIACAPSPQPWHELQLSTCFFLSGLPEPLIMDGVHSVFGFVWWRHQTANQGLSTCWC